MNTHRIYNPPPSVYNTYERATNFQNQDGAMEKQNRIEMHEASLEEDRILHVFTAVSEPLRDERDAGELFQNRYLEVGLVVDGSGVHAIDGKMIPCKSGDIYVVSPNIPHRYFLTAPSEPLVIRRLFLQLGDWFRGDVSTPGNKRYCYGTFSDGSSVAYAMLNANMRERITAILDAIEGELTDREAEWKAIVRSYLIQLFAFLGRYLSGSIKNAPRKSKEYDLVCTVTDIIDREFCDCELSLKLISKRVYTSPSQLSRIFKAYTGRLFFEYLREVRLRHAAKLLVESNLPVERIVSECGFRDISSFYRNFRESFDMTPQIYRQVSKLPAEQEVNETQNDNQGDKVKMEILSRISENVQIGKSKIVKELVQQAIDAGSDAEEILNKGLLDGMGVIGEKFKNNEVYVPQVLVAARAMSMGTELLKPYLVADGSTSKGKVCIGTVQGDLHDIGKNLVKMMMEGKGFEVIDLGTDVAPETFVQTAINENCQIICCSALLTTTMSVMGDVVKAVEAAGIRDKVKIMVGGAPINEEFCRAIGADSYSPDAASAADAAVALLAN